MVRLITEVRIFFRLSEKYSLWPIFVDELYLILSSVWVLIK